MADAAAHPASETTPALAPMGSDQDSEDARTAASSPSMLQAELAGLQVPRIDLPVSPSPSRSPLARSANAPSPLPLISETHADTASAASESLPSAHALETDSVLRDISAGEYPESNVEQPSFISIASPVPFSRYPCQCCHELWQFNAACTGRPATAAAFLMLRGFPRKECSPRDPSALHTPAIAWPLCAAMSGRVWECVRC